MKKAFFRMAALMLLLSALQATAFNHFMSSMAPSETKLRSAAHF